MTATTELGAGRELDALVAEKVMGYRWREVRAKGSTNTVPVWEGSAYRWPDGVYDARELAARGGPPVFSTSIAAAWQVVEKMREHPNVLLHTLHLVAYPYNRAYAAFAGLPDDGDFVEANGDHSVPLAICRAALRAIEATP